MSEDEGEIDIESGDEGDGRGGSLDKRAHHNALERKRRDHIKESFSGLRDAIPTMQGDKSSRAQILKKASEYIGFMRKKNTGHQREIDDLKKQNGHLEAQIRALERAKNSGQFNSASEVLESSGLNYDVNDTEVAPDSGTDGSFVVEEEAYNNTVQTVPTTSPGGSSRIQPGQSLLIMANGNGEPSRKKFKS